MPSQWWSKTFNSQNRSEREEAIVTHALDCTSPSGSGDPHRNEGHHTDHPKYLWKGNLLLFQSDSASASYQGLSPHDIYSCWIVMHRFLALTVGWSQTSKDRRRTVQPGLGDWALGGASHPRDLGCSVEQRVLFMMSIDKRSLLGNSEVCSFEVWESQQQQRTATLVWKSLLLAFHLWWECDALNAIIR
jgi:hypothetical protein